MLQVDGQIGKSLFPVRWVSGQGGWVSGNERQVGNQEQEVGGQGDERWVGEQGGERAQVRDSEWL